MPFLEPDQTPYDLQFRIFGAYVRVSPWFWLVSAIMGWSAMRLGFAYLLLWIGCVFVSILIHELGHVLTGRFFGAEGHIVLYSFGGLAIGSSLLAHRWQRIAVYFAGPVAGFLFLIGVWLVGAIAAPELTGAVGREFIATLQYLLGMRFDPMAIFEVPPGLIPDGLQNLIWINFFWGLLNLVPVWPLDGGRISRDLLEGARPADGVRLSLILSAVVAGLLALGTIYLFRGGSLYLTLFFALLAVQSFQMLQQLPPTRSWDDEPASWNRDR